MKFSNQPMAAGAKFLKQNYLTVSLCKATVSHSCVVSTWTALQLYNTRKFPRRKETEPKSAVMNSGCKKSGVESSHVLNELVMHCHRIPVASELGNRVLFPFSDPNGSTQYESPNSSALRLSQCRTSVVKN